MDLSKCLAIKGEMKMKKFNYISLGTRILVFITVAISLIMPMIGFFKKDVVQTIIFIIIWACYSVPMIYNT